MLNLSAERDSKFQPSKQEKPSPGKLLRAEVWPHPICSASEPNINSVLAMIRKPK